MLIKIEIHFDKYTYIELLKFIFEFSSLDQHFDHISFKTF